MKDFRSQELFCLHQGVRVMQTHCLKCKWFAAGSEEAIGIAQRAHKCRMSMPQEPDLLRELQQGC